MRNCILASMLLGVSVVSNTASAGSYYRRRRKEGRYGMTSYKKYGKKYGYGGEFETTFKKKYGSLVGSSVLERKYGYRKHRKKKGKKPMPSPAICMMSTPLASGASCMCPSGASNPSTREGSPFCCTLRDCEVSEISFQVTCSENPEERPQPIPSTCNATGTLDGCTGWTCLSDNGQVRIRVDQFFS